MNRVKKVIKYLGLIVLLLVLFRSYIYRACINYSIINTRNNIPLTNKNLISEIDESIEGKTLNIEAIIKLSNQITSEKLSFTFNNVSSDPNSAFELKKANCIGYSSLFNSIGNYIIEQQKLSNEYEFIHLVGELDFLGFNIHNLLNSPFFKDHDFNRIEDKHTGENKYVDPSLRDYLRIESVTH